MLKLHKTIPSKIISRKVGRIKVYGRKARNVNENFKKIFIRCTDFASKMKFIKIKVRRFWSELLTDSSKGELDLIFKIKISLFFNIKYYLFLGFIISVPPMYGRKTSGTVMLPSSL